MQIIMRDQEKFLDILSTSMQYTIKQKNSAEKLEFADVFLWGYGIDEVIRFKKLFYAKSPIA